jgi:large subunit ribosomal protein L19
MSQELISTVESAFRREKPLEFRVGDTVTVHQRIIEGDKERVQSFTGVVMGRRGHGTNETFTVRRIVNNEGVERIFPVNSPKIVGIEVVRSGRIRRAKLYYLRERVGKARRLRDRRMGMGAAIATGEDGAETGTEQAPETT